MGVEDKLELMPSLQRPKKIVFIGNDGNKYTYLCKPKDDLRKDARFMEICSLVDKLLMQNRESRKRSLHLRPYAVIPLNEECGLIEWVLNTIAYRNIIMKIYEKKNCVTSVHFSNRLILYSLLESTVKRNYCSKTPFKRNIFESFTPKVSVKMIRSYNNILIDILQFFMNGSTIIGAYLMNGTLPDLITLEPAQ